MYYLSVMYSNYTLCTVHTHGKRVILMRKHTQHYTSLKRTAHTFLFTGMQVRTWTQGEGMYKTHLITTKWYNCYGRSQGLQTAPKNIRFPPKFNDSKLRVCSRTLNMASFKIEEGVEIGVSKLKPFLINPLVDEFSLWLKFAPNSTRTKAKTRENRMLCWYYNISFSSIFTPPYLCYATKPVIYTKGMTYTWIPPNADAILQIKCYTHKKSKD